MIIDYNGLMAMDNVEDIEGYDITVGYPEKLNLT